MTNLSPSLCMPSSQARSNWPVLLVLAVVSFCGLLALLLSTGDLAEGAELAATITAVLGLLTLAARKFGAREVAIAGLLASVPLLFNRHIVVRHNYVGAADGIYVTPIDFWLLWLGIDCLFRWRRGALRPVRGFGTFLLPLGLLVLAEIVSFAHSDDAALTVYGIISHLRGVSIFVLLAVMLAQGVKERRAAIWGVLLAVAEVGLMCIVETLRGANLRENAFVDQTIDMVFRAGALDTPTGTAAYFAGLLPIVTAVFFFSRQGGRRMLAGCTLALGVTGLLCTVSRGSTAIFAAASLPLALFMYRNRLLRMEHVLACLIAVGVLYAGFGQKITTRVDEGNDNLNARLGLNSTAIQMGLNSPLFGEGVNNYWLKMDRFRPHTETQEFQYIVHNKFLLTFAESGVLGLAAFSWFIVAGLWRAAGLARQRRPLGVGLFCGVVALIVSMNVEPYDNGPALHSMWTLMALVAGYWSAQSTAAQSAAELKLALAPSYAAYGRP